MQSLRRQIVQHRITASWLLAMALLSTALLPAGFMPFVRDGSITIQICTGQGVQTTRMAVPGLPDHHDGQDDRKADTPCAFAGLGMGYAYAGALPSFALPEFQASEPFTSPAIAPEGGLAAPPPPSTGPPA